MNEMKNKLHSNGLSRNISLFACVLELVTLVAYCIYGVVFDYFDTVVCGFLVLAIVLDAVHFYVAAKAASACNLLSVMCLSGAIALFFLNSFPVWADELNGITMYASRGGLVPVIAILILLFVDTLAEIISCFIPAKEGK